MTPKDLFYLTSQLINYVHGLMKCLLAIYDMHMVQHMGFLTAFQSVKVVPKLSAMLGINMHAKRLIKRFEDSLIPFKGLTPF